MKSIAVLISGQGRNLQALIGACADGRIAARIAVVVSNRADAGGLEKAKQAGLRTAVIPHGDYATREAFDAALIATLEPHAPDIVVLAGFMRVLTPDFVRRYSGRLLNIHPSLLPKHPGLKTHQKVLLAGDHSHGATVHFVTADLDGGPAIIQGEFMVMPQDTEQSLAQRVMQDVELKIYPQAISWMTRGWLALQDGTVKFRGTPLTAPLGLNALEPEFQ